MALAGSLYVRSEIDRESTESRMMMKTFSTEQHVGGAWVANIYGGPTSTMCALSSLVTYNCSKN